MGEVCPVSMFEVEEFIFDLALAAASVGLLMFQVFVLH